MSKEKQKVYNVYRKVVKSLLLYVGIWPSKAFSVSQRIIQVVHLSVACFLLLGFVFYCKSVSDISKFVGGVGFILAYVSLLVKGSCILMNFQEFCDLKYTVDKKFNELLTDEKLRKYLLEEVIIFYRSNMNVNISVFVLGISLVVSPMISVLRQYFNHVPIITYPLAYQSAYPWKVPTHGLPYWVTYIVQAYGALDGSAITSAVDSIYIFTIFQMVGLLSALTYRLENLEHQKNPQLVLRQCIDEYGILIKCRDLIQDVFGPIIIWTILSNGLVMCFMVFQITHIQSIPLFRMISLALYVYFKMSQTFMWVWVGTRLATESEKCQEASADVDWQTDSKLKSTPLIMLSQRPLQLVACHCSVVSVDLFVKVLNTTVSYFFLISTLEEK